MSTSTQPPSRTRHKSLESPVRSKAHAGFGGRLRGKGPGPGQARQGTSPRSRPYWVVLEAAGLKVQLVSARAVKNAPGRAKTDKKDAVWLAKLTERGMLRPSFVPPPQIRRLREFTRLRADLVHERTRYWARLEKLLERALIKISSVASTLDTDSTRPML